MTKFSHCQWDKVIAAIAMDKGMDHVEMGEYDSFCAWQIWVFDFIPEESANKVLVLVLVHYYQYHVGRMP